MGREQRSTLRRKINRKKHAEVPEQFMRWAWTGGRKLKGLIRRRDAGSQLYQYFQFS
ncbi:glycoside hydrolase family protein [Olavius algarvensis spirochete endosymbiont]|uniref:glycoside hydrolase family protein n=1 Tax=Olavius algarvensis spirochete endosymbiont TaxID=260710 RepID=UPI00352C37DF